MQCQRGFPEQLQVECRARAGTLCLDVSSRRLVGCQSSSLCTLMIGIEVLIVLADQVSAQGVVSSYYEKQLAPAVNFLLSMVVDHAKGENTFGVGLSIGQ